MQPLTKDQAIQIADITSSIFQQGTSWVFREHDLDTGIERLTRGLTEYQAKKILKSWRREKVEELLRTDREARAYTLRSWHENPHWKGDKIWSWAQQHWYTSREEAEKALEKRIANDDDHLEIYETKVADLPGHLTIAV